MLKISSLYAMEEIKPLINRLKVIITALKSHSGFCCFKLIVFAALFIASGWISANKQIDGDRFVDLSLEELMTIKVINVTSFSRHSQKLTEVPSAIFVITQDDIRRSGVTSIPEALRMAPGVEVARIGTDKWAVSVRGFNGRFANKLQVLMDGRSVYNPLFAGVQWDLQDTLIEDIERIEVIRGPAASVWGANAVNGVINIITRKASDTQGGLITGGGGSFEHGFMGARYGGKIGEDTHYRMYAKGFTRDNMQSISGEKINDAWHQGRGGFRLDHTRGIDQITLQGDVFYNSIGDTLDKSLLSAHLKNLSSARGYNTGGNIRFRWDRNISDRSSIVLQSYYDRTDYDLVTATRFRAESFDIDFQHRFPLFERHDITWGGNYRLYHNKFYDTELISLFPRQRNNDLISGFVRDEITLIPDRLRLMLGVRLDHNDFTGLEVQPDMRLTWMPDEKNTVWMSIARAVRIPSRAENDILLNTRIMNQTHALSHSDLPIMPYIQGSPGLKSEKLLAYELGYRHQLSSNASLDVATFFNDYSQLRDMLAGDIWLHTKPSPHQMLPVSFNNQASGTTYGIEVSADWKPNERLRFQGNYSFLKMHINSNPLFNVIDPTSGGADKANPQHQFSFRTNYDVTEKLQLNLWLRYTSNLPLYNIPGYVTMDSKLVYRPVRNIDFFVVGQNLFSQNHQETISDFVFSQPAYIPRGVYGGVQWRF